MKFLNMKEKKQIIFAITEIQKILYVDRKKMSTQSDNEWNAKAHMVFAHEHLNTVKRNLMRKSDYRDRHMREEIVTSNISKRDTAEP